MFTDDCNVHLNIFMETVHHKCIIFNLFVCLYVVSIIIIRGLLSDNILVDLHNYSHHTQARKIINVNYKPGIPNQILKVGVVVKLVRVITERTLVKRENVHIYYIKLKLQFLSTRNLTILPCVIRV